MKYQDYYQILGVSRDAGPEEIKKAFRRLARKYHPDVSKEADAEARMQEVNEAYTVLSDPEKRAAYDRLGQGWHAGEEFRPPPDWGGEFHFGSHGFSPDEATEFSDFFSQLFGGLGGFGRQPRGFRSRGADHRAQVLLDIEDAFTGATRQLSLQQPQADAQGRVTLATRTLNVKIPPGVREGQIIRLAGQGEPGTGGPAGDLLLEVRFRPHARLRAEGRNLHMALPVAPWEAALGAVVPVQLPAGTLKVRIPEGSQSGRQLRVRGKGIPGSPAGDLLLDIQVVLPRADTPKARQLYETMARELAFDPRDAGRA
ncbi:DnaJ C-terminal domain-containing protein [Thauera butanivorans]|uniref:DnaJ C-terminal domain-containing protein n=1 Tax=Thauera butanivorans TaxID=86174 RepID=UPI000838309B|nr:DnaJ C-terminal domain-containing protein [Thauera butanivorans]